MRPAVGRSPTDPDRFIEFTSEDAAQREGFEPVGPYRVCEVWDDYLDPWPAPLPGTTDAESLALEGPDPHTARPGPGSDADQSSDILKALQ
jgi:hypothetical protein